MRKIISVIAVVCLMCLALAGCGDLVGMNSGERDVLYNDTVYIRSEFPNYNIELLSDNETYIGDFIETYDHGNQLPWEVFSLNSEGNVLYSAHALWLKPGYTLPDEFGEELCSAEYVIAEGILDDYKEDVTFLAELDSGTTLDDIIAAEPSQVTGLTEHANIRFRYASYSDIAISLGLFSLGDTYYLSVCEDVRGDDVFYAVNAEFVPILTSALEAK